MSSLQSALAAPVLFFSFEKFGLGLPHLLSLDFQMKAQGCLSPRNHAANSDKSAHGWGICSSSLSRQMLACGNARAPDCSAYLWTLLSSSPLVTVTVGGKQHLLGLYDTAGQVHFYYLHLLLSSFIFIILIHSIDITSSEHCLPKWQPKHILNIIKIFIIPKN